MKEKDLWEEEISHPRSDWRAEVAAEDTQLGYWEWVEHKIEEDPDVAAKRLAAAAPDLLRALEAVVARISGEYGAPPLLEFGPLSVHTVGDCHTIAKMAIAKATGRKP